MAKKGKSKYGSLRSKVQAGKEQLEKTGGVRYFNLPDGVEFWSPPAVPHGKSFSNAIFDILPYQITIENHIKGIPPRELFQQLAYAVHYGVGSEEKTVVCPKSVGKKCPICEHMSELFTDYNANKEEIKDLRPKQKMAFNILDLNDEEKGIQVFDLSIHRFANKLYEEIEANAPDYDTVFDLDGGFSLKVRFAEKTIGSGKPFLEATRVDFEPRDPYGDDIVDEAVDLDKCLNIMSYEEIEALFMDMPYGGGTTTATEDDVPVDSEEEEAPPSRGHRNRRTVPVEDEEPEASPATRTRSRTRTRPEPEPDPEPEEEPEEEEGGGDNQCPEGFEFGVDCERHDECDQCPTETWQACKDEEDRLKAAKKGAGRRARK